MSPQLLRRRARPHTGELPDRPRLYAHAPVEQTPLLLSALDNAAVLDAILRFDQALTEYAIRPPAPTPPDGDAVAAVAYIARVLDVPERDVIDGAGLAERTFHEWKANGRKPRLASLGQLWTIVQAVEDLTTEIDDLPRWIKADPRRRELLRTGELDALHADATGASSPATATADTTVGYALGTEELSPALSSRRKTSRQPTTQRQIRRRPGGDTDA